MAFLWNILSLNFCFNYRKTVKMAYERGLVVEPSGAAALAAFLMGKVSVQ